MFERFTDRARRVIVLAQNDAREFGHGAIQPAHVLLALLEEGTGIASRAMTSIGVDQVTLRARVESAFDVTDERKHVERLPFSPKAKKLLELSLREALQLGHSYIGTEHLLLAVLRLTVRDDPETDEMFGVPVKRLRKAVLTAMTRGSSHDGRFSPALARAMGTAHGLAGRGPTTTGHLLSAMVDDPRSQAARALSSLAASKESVVRAVAEVPIDQTTDAAPEVVIEVHVAGRTLRLADADLVAKLSSATTEQVLGALRRLAEEIPGGDPPRTRPGPPRT